jgi:antitoxin component YwqK of YwqJK toxin-antitoxin module
LFLQTTTYTKNKYDNRGVYKLKYKDCPKYCMNQTGRTFPTDGTMEIMTAFKKGKHLNTIVKYHTNCTEAKQAPE